MLTQKYIILLLFLQLPQKPLVSNGGVLLVNSLLLILFLSSLDFLLQLLNPQL